MGKQAHGKKELPEVTRKIHGGEGAELETLLASAALPLGPRWMVRLELSCAPSAVTTPGLNKSTGVSGSFVPVLVLVSWS